MSEKPSFESAGESTNADRYDKERRAQAFLEGVVKQWQSSRANFYTNPEHADRRAGEITEDLSKRASEIDGLREVPFRLSGEGVLRPNTLDGNGDTEVLYTSPRVNLREPIRSLEPLETQDATFEGFTVRTTPSESRLVDKSVLYVNKPMLIFRQSKESVRPVNIGFDGIQMLNVSVTEKYLVDVTNKDIALEPVELIRAAELERAIERLAVSGVEMSRLVNRIRGLEEELQKEDPLHYTKMEDTSILREIASTSEAYLKQASFANDDVSSALIGAIGRGRHLELSGLSIDITTPNKMNELKGGHFVAVDALTLPVGEDGADSLVLVLESGKDIVYAPLKHINTFAF